MYVYVAKLEMGTERGGDVVYMYMSICRREGEKKCIELYHGCMNKKREVLLFGCSNEQEEGGVG